MENQNTDVDVLLGQNNDEEVSLAELMKKAANFLNSWTFTVSSVSYNKTGNSERVRGLILLDYVYEKENFLKAVKDFPHKMYKIYDDYNLTCLYQIAPYVYYGYEITRSSVCKKITRWECEPLLSPEEDASI